MFGGPLVRPALQQNGSKKQIDLNSSSEMTLQRQGNDQKGGMESLYSFLKGKAGLPEVRLFPHSKVKVKLLPAGKADNKWPMRARLEDDFIIPWL